MDKLLDEIQKATTYIGRTKAGVVFLLILASILGPVVMIEEIVRTTLVFWWELLLECVDAAKALADAWTHIDDIAWNYSNTYYRRKAAKAWKF